ncbi:MAG: hypothetical protein JXR70_17125 [Spirochaetales bacterium]|nr:hypothetical protein [Spirochaetales bacterium]
MKKKPKLLILYLFLLSVSTFRILAQTHQPAQFRFAQLVYNNGVDTDFSRIKSSEKDHIKVFFQSIKNTFFYSMLITPSQSMVVIYPDIQTGFSPKLFQKLSFSSQKEWFFESGVYSLYYIFSEKRITDLEANFKEFLQIKTSEQKMKIVRRILAIVRQLRREQELVSNLNDLPSPIVGTFRNNEERSDTDLLQLYFSETDIQDSDLSCSGITPEIQNILEEAAELVEFKNSFIKEISIEFNE